MKEIAPLLWIVAIALIFWLLIIRPAQRRQREISQVQSSLVAGDSVILTSGVYGTITEIGDSTMMVEVAPGVVLKVDRRAINSVLRDDEPEGTVEDTPSSDAAPGTIDDNEER